MASAPLSSLTRSTGPEDSKSTIVYTGGTVSSSTHSPALGSISTGIPSSGMSFGLPSNVQELLWEEKNRSLRELISNYRLPLAVKLKSGDILKYVSSVHNLTGDNDATQDLTLGEVRGYASVNGSRSAGRDLNQNSVEISFSPDGKDYSSSSISRKEEDTNMVLQIHEIRRKKIILARKMTWEKRQNDYVVNGEHVEIPANFKGWLEVVPDDGRPVEYFDTVGAITSIKPRRFLVRTTTVGYQLSTEETGNSSWMPIEIKPGQVLTTGIIYMDNKKNKNSTQRSIFKRFRKQSKVKKEQELKYLQCFDGGGQEMMIPLIMSGVFSPVGDPSMANYDAVYELQDLIMAFGLPINAQLIHSNPTTETCQCPRGVLRLDSTREEELVTMSRVGPDGALFTENNEERFQVPMDKNALFSRGVVRKKPAIKAKLVDVFNSQWDKEKVTTSGKTTKHKHYFRATSIDEFKLRNAHQDRRLSTPTTIKATSTKATPVMAHYNTHGVKVNTDIGASQARYNSEGSEHSSEIYSRCSPSKQNTASAEITPLNSSPQIDVGETDENETVGSFDVELPERANIIKKTKSTGLLNILSVRRVKKKRAKLKELKGDDVFSKRITRNDLIYQDFFGGLDNDEQDTTKDTGGNSSSREHDTIHTASTNDSSSTKIYGSSDKISKRSHHEKTGSKGTDHSSLVQHRHNFQKRDLPPIPSDSPHRSETSEPVTTSYQHNMSKDSIYEHLPPAPQPPPYRGASTSSPIVDIDNDNTGDDEAGDGYMVPMQFRGEPRDKRYSKVNLHHKPPNDSLRYARARRTRSEVHVDHSDDCPLDIDDLFSFAYSSNDQSERSRGGLSGHHTMSTSHLYGVPDNRIFSWRSDFPPSMAIMNQRFMDKLDLETRGYHHQSVGRNSRAQKARAMSVNPNATMRSHNLRKLRPNAMEVFNFTDSFKGLRDTDEHVSQLQQAQPNMPSDNHVHSAYVQSLYSRPPLQNSRSMDGSMSQIQQQQNIYSPGFGLHYAESEPCYRHNYRSASIGGMNEQFLKYDDDSAISIHSRGDGGFPNESEYSYNEYSEQTRQLEDGWTPPDEIEGMTVQEVSKSLRYIGMKDRVVLQFSNEQIDGNMLVTLDTKHLKEGFPELNALELKKILDFMKGWRPKKK